MIQTYRGRTVGKSEEFVDELNSVGFQLRAKAWERIRDDIRVLQEANRKSGV